MNYSTDTKIPQRAKSAKRVIDKNSDENSDNNLNNNLNNNSNNNFNHNSDHQCQWSNSLQSLSFRKVEQRVIKQLLRTLMYENIYPYDYQKIDSEQNAGIFILHAKTLTHEDVQYRCYGEIKNSFSHIQLAKTEVIRIAPNQPHQIASLDDVINEIVALIPDGKHIVNFINEIEQTLLKDVQAQNLPRPDQLPIDQRQYDELESNLMDAHTYHPCYKSRIGFSLSDNQRYGPEFKPSLQLCWIAIDKTNGAMSHTKEVDYTNFITQEIGKYQYQIFATQLSAAGKNIKDYWLMPVHPWQWEAVISVTFYSQIVNQSIIYLGQGNDQYRPQQSIRTLANLSDKTKHYVKFSLSITNTSSTRILANHTVKNGPLITDWLQGLIANDTVAKRFDFIILGEVLGVTFDYRRVSSSQQLKAHGALGTLWRESIHTYLRDNESATPFNGLFHLEKNASPLIAPWIAEYGLHAWVTQLLQVAVNPIIHMLFAHGIGMESHAQNIVLIHKQGWPTRVALKDFHDGVRYCPEHLAAPQKCPHLFDVPQIHTELNRNSFILTQDLESVRDFSCDAFFFICLSELCIFLNQHYQMSEKYFWAITANIVKQYQADNPQFAVRFKTFDLFSDTFTVGQFTKRRVFGDEKAHTKTVANPLRLFK